MTTTTARVEVLTAEVRVLMVGSRQITLSVHAQLDEVPYTALEPFGRVAPRGAAAEFVYVVGASTRDRDRGTLVRSSRESAASLHSRAEQSRRGAENHREMAALIRERLPLAQAADQASTQYFRRINGTEERPVGWDGDKACSVFRGMQQQARDMADRIARMRIPLDPYSDDDPCTERAARKSEGAAGTLEGVADHLVKEAGRAAPWSDLPLIVLAGLR